jgi:hypothetical protein
MNAINQHLELPALEVTTPAAALTPSQQALAVRLQDTDPLNPVTLALKANPDLDVLKLRAEIDKKVWSALDYQVTDALDDEARERLLDELTTAFLAFRQVEDRANVALGSPYKINANTTRQLQGGGLNKQMAPAKTPYQFNPAEQVFLEDVVANINAYNGTANLGDALNTTLDTLLNKDTLAFVPKGYGINSPPALDVRTQQREALEAVIANGQKALATSDPIRTLPPSAAEQLVTLATALDTRDYPAIDSAWTDLITNADLTVSERVGISSRVGEYLATQGYNFDANSFLAPNGDTRPHALPAGDVVTPPPSTIPEPVAPSPVAEPPLPAEPAAPATMAEAPPSHTAEPVPAENPAPTAPLKDKRLPQHNAEALASISQLKQRFSAIEETDNFKSLNSLQRDFLKRKYEAHWKDAKNFITSETKRLEALPDYADNPEKIMTEVWDGLAKKAKRDYLTNDRELSLVFMRMPDVKKRAIVDQFQSMFTQPPNA